MRSKSSCRNCCCNWQKHVYDTLAMGEVKTFQDGAKIILEGIDKARNSILEKAD